MSLVAEYEASGLSRRSFCTARGLAVATLDLYRKRASHGSVRPQLVAVEIERGSNAVREQAPGSSLLTVVLGNGRRIEVGGAFDAGLLSELLVVLERA
jgi:hypothetical protein